MVHPFLVEEFRSTQVLFGGSSGARVAVLSLVIWEMFGAENVSHYYGLASGLGGDGCWLRESPPSSRASVGWKLRLVIFVKFNHRRLKIFPHSNTSSILCLTRGWWDWSCDWPRIGGRHLWCDWKLWNGFPDSCIFRGCITAIYFGIILERRAGAWNAQSRFYSCSCWGIVRAATAMHWFEVGISIQEVGMLDLVQR